MPTFLFEDSRHLMKWSHPGRSVIECEEWGVLLQERQVPAPLSHSGNSEEMEEDCLKKKIERDDLSLCIKARPLLSASSTQRYYFIHFPFLKLHFVRLAQGQTTTHNRNLLLPFLPRPQVFSWDHACHPSLPGPPALLCCLYRRVCMCVSLLFSLWVLEIVPNCALSLVAG